MGCLPLRFIRHASLWFALFPAVTACASAPGDLRFGAMLAQTVFLLLAVGALAVLTLRAAARAGWGGAASTGAEMEILERLTVSPRESILALRAGARVVIVARGPHGMRTLAEMPEAEWRRPRFSDALAAARPPSPTSSETSWPEGNDEDARDEISA